MNHRILAAGLAWLLAAGAAQAQGTPAAPALQETITPLFRQELPNAPGKALLALEVQFPPGAASPPHKHPRSAFIYAYVLSGEIVSAVDDEAPRTYRAGQSWQEAPGAHHRVTRNASTREPARLLVIFVLDPGETQLVVPDPG